MRYTEIDRIRGLCLVSMLLGHAILLATGRASTELWHRETSAYTDLTAFLVRYFNNTSAPMFFFLLGVSVALLIAGRRDQGRSDTAINLYLIFRGVLLIYLQFTLVNVAWALGEGGTVWRDLTLATLLLPRVDWFYFGVLSTLGISLLCLTILARLGNPTLLLIACVIVVSPDIYLTLVGTPDVAAQLPIWVGILAVPGTWHSALVLYTPIPWTGIALAGFVWGRWLLSRPETAWRGIYLAVVISTGIFAGAVLLRWLSGTTGSVISVLHLHRYTPDLLLLVLAISVNGGLLLLMRRVSVGAVDGLLELFGRTSLFCYVVHLYVLALFVTLLGRDLSLGEGASLAVLATVVMGGLCLLYRDFRTWFLQRLGRLQRSHLPVSMKTEGRQ